MEKGAQLEFIMNIVAPIEGDWCSNLISECVATPQSIVSNLGIIRNSSTASASVISPAAKVFLLNTEKYNV